MRPVLISMLVLLMSAGFVYADSDEDSTLFVAACNAQQQKNHLLALATGEQLLQAFPDTPLRDITLLLMARSSLQSGDTQRAAALFSRFLSEFPDRTRLAEGDTALSGLHQRLKQGERLLPDRQLQAQAAQRYADFLLQEQRRKADIQAVVKLSAPSLPVAAGETALLPLEIANRGSTAETYLLEVTAPPDYGASIPVPEAVGNTFTQLRLAPGEVFSSAVTLSMPTNKVDGYRAAIAVRAQAAGYADIVYQDSTIVTTSAPLIRVVTRLYRSNGDTADRLRYHVTVLNIGSLAARDIGVRVQLPPELLLLDAPGETFQREQDGGFVFKRADIASGRLVELDLEVQQIKSAVSVDRALLGYVEIRTGQLKGTQRFTTRVVTPP